MPSQRAKQWSVLASSTLAFTVCFMIWVMFGEIGIPIKSQLGLSDTQFGILAATPVLSGALSRVPLGILTDKYGGRRMMAVLLLLCVPAVFAIQFATHFWHFLAIGLVMGLAGGSFSVGTPYVARWFPPEQKGMAMGVFGAGNAGSALTKFLAPALIAIGTWTLVPNVYAAILLATAIIFWLTSYDDPSHTAGAAQIPLREQLALLKDPGVLKYSQYYSVVFGGYVGLTLWMTKFYVGQYGLSLQTAALLAACFSLPGGVLRAFGGYLSDKFGAHKVTSLVMWLCLICFFILSYPPTDFVIHGKDNQLIDMHISLSVEIFTILMFTVGIAMAVGKASVFKYVADDYHENIGAVSGIVGLAGGVGGFLLPIMFGALEDITGVRSVIFMLLFGTTAVSLMWMHLSVSAKQDKADEFAKKG